MGVDSKKPIAGEFERRVVILPDVPSQQGEQSQRPQQGQSEPKPREWWEIGHYVGGDDDGPKNQMG
jgi:hypothetical protein